MSGHIDTVTVVTLSCNICPQPRPNRIRVTAPNITAARAAAAREGWFHTRVDKGSTDMCPEHARQYFS